MQPLAFSEPSTLHMSDKVHWTASSLANIGDELPPGAQRYTSHTFYTRQRKGFKDELRCDFSVSPSASALLWNLSTPRPSVRIPATLRVNS